jgi:phage baseplate assembly protein W
MAVIYTQGLSVHTREWSDLDLDFTMHPVTKDIVRKTNVEAVKRSVRNLILTNRYERPFHPEIDGGVTRHLFSLSTPETKHDIKLAVENCLTNFEPRVVVDDVRVTGDLDANGFNVSIYFTVVNSPQPIEVALFLERIR